MSQPAWMTQAVNAQDSYSNPNPAAFRAPIKMWMTPAEYAAMGSPALDPNVQISQSAPTQISSPITNLPQMTIGNDMGMGGAINLGYGLLGQSPGTGALSNPVLAKSMPGTPGNVQTSSTPAWLAWIQSKAGDYGVVFFGAALALGALLISQKDTAIKIAGAIK